MEKAMSKVKFDLNNLSQYRKALGANQSAFWQTIGVTQSGGSRYENERDMPIATAILLTLRETGKITQADIDSARKFVEKSRKG